MDLNKRILDTIFQVVHDEDLELQRTAKQGIFFAPELALVYLIGRKIYQKRKYIFHTEDVKWLREQKIGTTGICDLIFEICEGDFSRKVYIEFKLRDNVDSYARDIEKLREKDCYSHIDIRLFCAVIDAFEFDRDGRIDMLEKKFDKSVHPEGAIFRINENFADYSFETVQNWYKKQVYAIVGLWEVKGIGDESLTMDDAEDFISIIENSEN
ncbi:MAG: hypothetical protein ACXWEY_04495 [Bacteroidia bacterium]